MTVKVFPATGPIANALASASDGSGKFFFFAAKAVAASDTAALGELATAAEALAPGTLLLLAVWPPIPAKAPASEPSSPLPLAPGVLELMILSAAGAEDAKDTACGGESSAGAGAGDIGAWPEMRDPASSA